METKTNIEGKLKLIGKLAMEEITHCRIGIQYASMRKDYEKIVKYYYREEQIRYNIASEGLKYGYEVEIIEKPKSKKKISIKFKKMV